jgi:hypothetical protein
MLFHLHYLNRDFSGFLQGEVTLNEVGRIDKLSQQCFVSESGKTCKLFILQASEWLKFKNLTFYLQDLRVLPHI